MTPRRPIRRKPLKRKASVKPHTVNARKSGVKRVNVARRVQEFARAYGSKERVAFVKARRCAYCTFAPPSENAHLPSQHGMGRKGPYTDIIPLCRTCHVALDAHRLDSLLPVLRLVAETIETDWQATHPEDRTP